MDTNIYCLPEAGLLHSQNKVIQCAVGAIMNGRRNGGGVRLQKLITDLDMRNGHKGGL
jgi:hypothetical protein